ncbi:hypothetical protein [Brachybacterium atlanticum]|uniref:hypothetical protein n=1 Tax=Brachybacterium atlanticum TaxID=2911888 RepID=UPI0021DF867A|nr:hypothetical protein [Brachybacterium atlanticum]
MTTTPPDSAPDRSQAAVARLAMITLNALETEPLARFWSEGVRDALRPLARARQGLSGQRTSLASWA